jgi:pyruvate carboxylase
VVEAFVKQAATGVDVFRVFDCLNWVENMRVAMDAVIDADKVCEGSICYTGDILDPNRAKYDLAYYVALGKGAEAAGAHILGLKDMAGLLKPAAARQLVKALKRGSACRSTSTPTTPRAAAATILAAVEMPGSMPVDARWTALSGNTSQPTLGSLVEALANTDRDPGLDAKAIRADLVLLGSGAHPVRGLRERPSRARPPRCICTRCRAGSSPTSRSRRARWGWRTRWHEVAQAYADVNQMFGDIVKVTPSSKVVGDMALMPWSRPGLTREDVENPTRDIAFPDSVVFLLRGDLGQPPGGFPEKPCRRRC